MYFWETCILRQETIESMIFLRLTIDNIFEFAPWAHHARAAKRLNAPWGIGFGDTETKGILSWRLQLHPSRENVVHHLSTGATLF
jgi:hypothetical protein